MTDINGAGDGPQAWYDSRRLQELAPGGAVLEHLFHSSYSGAVLYTDNAEQCHAQIPRRWLRVLSVDGADELSGALAADFVASDEDASERWVIASESTATLDLAREKGLRTCLRATVADGPSLHAAIEAGRAHGYLLLRFTDPTNIPLELVIAELQPTGTVVIKEIADGAEADAAVVSLGVMEVGSDGVFYSPADYDTLDEFLRKLADARTSHLAIDEAVITATRPIGMGQRSCIDLVTLFSPDEGMLIGSTSQGGMLCCPEVFYLPYMDLRPFRVNAGGVHSYVYGANGRTNYLTELSAGMPMSVVGLDGTCRRAPVGRIKTEVRPLRLIAARFADGEDINIIMQDDWHVRVYSATGEPRNITELKRGDKVLGHLSTPGRHVGIPITEAILES